MRTYINEVIENINNKPLKIIEDIDQQEKIFTANAIYNLRSEIDKQFPDNKLLLSYSKEIKKYIPNHFLANVFELLSTKQYDQLNSYLNAFDFREISQKLLELVLDKLIDNIDSKIGLIVASLIESEIKDLKIQNKLFSKFEKEIEKIDSTTYLYKLHRDVFISHSIKDIKETTDLVNYLEAMGYTCWVASRNLRHGANEKAGYEDNIKSAIRNCSIFLLIGSDNSRNRGCDSYKIETPYLMELDRYNQPYELKATEDKWDIKYKKPRVEYMLNSYSSSMNPFEKYIKGVFDGFNNCLGKEQLVNLLEELLNEKCDKKDSKETEGKGDKKEETNSPTKEIMIIKLPNGSIYEGEILNGKANGHGVLNEANGSVYDGEFKDGEPNGYGVYKKVDGSVYEGELKDGKPHGYGVYKNVDGSIYEGELKDGNANGRGKYRYPSGNIYEGELVDNNKNGRGVFIFSDGEVYRGEFKDDRRNGNGEMYFASGAVYKGEWKDDLRNGYGVMKFENGDIYEGEWKNDMANGHGILKKTDGNKMEGKWKDGKLVKEICMENSNNEHYLRNGKSIEFGSYPQTKVEDKKLISVLNIKASTKQTESNSESWTSYGYYIEGEVSNDMWYIDIEEGGEKYRGVYFTQYRPCSTTISSSSNQDDNGYNTNTVYWFKYEPIKWTIVEESNGYATLVCDTAIDSQEYYSSRSEVLHSHNGGTGYPNNYALSNIRKWLNETFYNTAFIEEQKSIIQTTEVDNSLASTGDSSNSYICTNTQDKVYLLSYKEAKMYYTSTTSREKKSSDYAKSQGCCQYTISSYLGNCYWWLRSPDDDYSSYANCVYGGGHIYSYYVDRTDYGVVPALKIKL